MGPNFLTWTTQKIQASGDDFWVMSGAPSFYPNFFICRKSAADITRNWYFTLYNQDGAVYSNGKLMQCEVPAGHTQGQTPPLNYPNKDFRVNLGDLLKIHVQQGGLSQVGTGQGSAALG